MTRQEVVPDRLSGATVVVIDVFMATTTLLTILENGARGVYPVAGLREADEVAAKRDASRRSPGGSPQISVGETSSSRRRFSHWNFETTVRSTPPLLSKRSDGTMHLKESP